MANGRAGSSPALGTIYKKGFTENKICKPFFYAVLRRLVGENSGFVRYAVGSLKNFLYQDSALVKIFIQVMQGVDHGVFQIICIDSGLYLSNICLAL